MGVESRDCCVVARMVGIKTFINEFLAYEDLGKVRKNNDVFDSYTGQWTMTASCDVFLVDRNETLKGGVLTVSISHLSHFVCFCCLVCMLVLLFGLYVVLWWFCCLFCLLFWVGLAFVLCWIWFFWSVCFVLVLLFSLYVVLCWFLVFSLYVVLCSFCSFVRMLFHRGFVVWFVCCFVFVLLFGLYVLCWFCCFVCILFFVGFAV